MFRLTCSCTRWLGSEGAVLEADMGETQQDTGSACRISGGAGNMHGMVCTNV